MVCKMKPLAQQALDNQKQIIELIFIHHVLKIHLIVGWKKLEIGLFLDNYGGVTKFAWYHNETGEVYVGEEAPAISKIGLKMKMC